MTKMKTDKYKVLNQYHSITIENIVLREIPADSDDSLDWISTGYMILSLRHNKNYSTEIIRKYIEYIQSIDWR